MHRMLARRRLLEHKVAEFEQLVAALEANVHANDPEPKTYEVRRVVVRHFTPRMITIRLDDVEIEHHHLVQRLLPPLGPSAKR